MKDRMLDLKQLTADVCRIATEVGYFLKEERKNFRRERVVEKHAHDYVSYVDKESEVRVVKALTALLPEAGFITEEGSATYQDEPYCWVIDPLDGTTNYIHDEAPYCVSITRIDGVVRIEEVKKTKQITVTSEDTENPEQESYAIPYGYKIRVREGQAVTAGEPLTEGSITISISKLLFVR